MKRSFGSGRKVSAAFAAPLSKKNEKNQRPEPARKQKPHQDAHPTWSALANSSIIAPEGPALSIRARLFHCNYQCAASGKYYQSEKHIT